jgi:uncharacterized membrane protein YbhN (UPF0104 family)
MTRYLKVIIGGAILALLVWRLGTGAFIDGLRMIGGGPVLAALGLGLLTTVCCAARWCIVARGLGLRLGLGTATADYYRSILLNSVLPMGVAGDVHRAVSHGKSEGDVGRGVRAVFLERTAGQVVLIVAAVPVLLTQPTLFALVSGSFGYLLLGIGVAGSALAAWARWGRGAERWRRAVRTGLADVRRGLLTRDTWPGAMVLSAAVLVLHVTLFVVAARAAGVTAPVTRLLPLLILALLVMGLPLNIGGWGPREAVSAAAFGATGLGAAHGVSVAVVYGVLSLVACLPGAGVVAFRAYERRADKYPPNASTSPVRTALPLAAVASEGRPMIPESV